MEADHKIRCASISKVFVGMTAMLLREDGLLDLDGDISPYWGVTARNPRYPEIPITFRSLMSHTSSIRVFGDGVSRSYSAVRSKLGSSAGYSSVMPGAITSWNYNADGVDAPAVLGGACAGGEDHHAVPCGRVVGEEAVDAVGAPGLFCLQRDGQRSLLKILRMSSKGSFSSGFSSSPEMPRMSLIILAAARMAISSPLLETSINGARGILVNVSGPADISFEDVELAASMVQAAVHPDANTIFGAAFDETLNDEIRVTVIATGFDEKKSAKDSRGIYAVCGEISQYIYDKIA